MYGGRDQKHIAYVSIGGNLKRRIHQHLIGRDSSVSTGTSAVGLNPDYITEVTWWEHPKFKDRDHLIVAELVAFEILNPALRSRGNVSKAALEVYTNQKYKSEIKHLLEGEASGKLILPSLEILMDRITDLEQRVKKLEKG